MRPALNRSVTFLTVLGGRTVKILRRSIGPSFESRRPPTNAYGEWGSCPPASSTSPDQAQYLITHFFFQLQRLDWQNIVKSGTNLLSTNSCQCPDLLAKRKNCSFLSRISKVQWRLAPMTSNISMTLLSRLSKKCTVLVL